MQSVRGRLTPRQMDVFDLMVEGRNAREIAVVLGIGSETVRQHMATVYRAAGVGSHVRLLARFLAA